MLYVHTYIPHVMHKLRPQNNQEHTHKRGGAHGLLDQVGRAVDDPRRHGLGQQRPSLEGVQVPPPQPGQPPFGLPLGRARVLALALARARARALASARAVDACGEPGCPAAKL